MEKCFDWFMGLEDVWTLGNFGHVTSKAMLDQFVSFIQIEMDLSYWDENGLLKIDNGC